MPTSSRPSSKSTAQPPSRSGNQAFQHITPTELSSLVKESAQELKAIGANPEDHYKSFPKTRNGKTRLFNPPRARLRRIHDHLMSSVFSSYQAHPAAYATPGGGNMRASRKHLRNRWLLHLDLKDFFPSVARWKVERGLLQLDFRADVIDLLCGLVVLNDGLPQGAPTSPLFANIVLEGLDRRIEGLAEKHGFVYTRYLDDLHLSGDWLIDELAERQVKRIIEQESWSVHPEKGGVFGPTDRQEILGLSVNQSLGPRHGYVREVRRRIRDFESRATPISEAEYQSLAGQVAWVSVLSPGRGRALRTLMRGLARRGAD